MRITLVLIRVTIAVWKHRDQKHLGKGKVYVAYSTHHGLSSQELKQSRNPEAGQRRWRGLLDKILCATDLGGKEPRGPTLGERQTHHADSIYVGVLLREREWGKEPGRDGRREGRNEGGRRGGEREGEANIFLPLQENS